MKRHVLTRRQFLKSSSAAVAGAVFLGSPERVVTTPKKKTRVVLVRHEDVLDDDRRARPELLEQMLDDAVAALTDERDPQRWWNRVFKPEDRVGIKSNVWGYLPTPRALESAIATRVAEAGVAEKHIGIDDRGVLRNRRFLDATALVNVRPFRTHHWSGVGSLLKNYIMFVPRPDAYHGDACADLAKIWRLPLVRGKTRLNILVLLTPLFHGIGPHHYHPKYTWPYGGLLVGFDPVAVDATAVRILLAKRKAFFGEERPINPPPKHVFLADSRHGLGTADPARIDLVRLGWMEGALI